MNTNNKLIEIQDKKVTLSTLWVFVMFCIAYADIIGFIEPGTLENIINGNVGFELPLRSSSFSACFRQFRLR